MKRIISVLLALFMLCAVIPFSSVFAATANSYSENAYNTVVAGLKSFSETVDISSYSLTQNQVGELMQDILYNEPMLFYLELSYYVWPGSNNTISKIQPIYTMTKSQVDTATSYVNGEIEKIIATVPENLDDYEKALYLYEYVVLSFDYDDSLKIYDINNLFKNGVGVCQAYSLLYDELLYRCGIDSRAVTSDTLVHMWNEVKLNGKWYQVDVTWGDYESPFETINHKYFLMSNSQSKSLHENANDIIMEYDCTDTTFDNIAWKNSYRQYAFANGNTYQMNQDGEYIQELNLKTNATKDVFFIGTENNEYFMDQLWKTNSRLVSYDERLIYNSGSKIMYYDPATEENALLYTASQGNILQMQILSDKVKYSPIDKSNTTNVYFYTIDFSNATIIKPTNPDDPDDPDDPDLIIYGDVNGDKAIDKKDYALLKRFCFGAADLTEAQKLASDVNHDENVDKKDYATLKRHCFGAIVIQ